MKGAFDMFRDIENSKLIDGEFIKKLSTRNIFIKENKFSSGQLILKTGQVSEQLHIISNGEVSIYLEQEQNVKLATLSKGQFFGEMSCLTGNPVSAHVEAIDEVTTISLPREGMMLLMDENPSFRMQIIEDMVKRIQNSNTRVAEEHIKSIVMMEQHNDLAQNIYGDLIGETEGIEKIRTQIERFAKEKSNIIIYGEAGTEKITVAKKIHDATTGSGYPFIVIEADKFDLNTLHSKLTAAKEGTIVFNDADAIGVDVLAQIMNKSFEGRMIFTMTKQLELSATKKIVIPPLRDRVDDIPLLAKSFVEKISNLQWEEAISEDAIRLLTLFPYLSKNLEELQSVVNEAYILSDGRKIFSNHIRFGSNRKPGERPKIGLALGSGSARGVAHLGVLKVLEEEGIPIDMIAGTSAGSLMGGAYAAGVTVKDMMTLAASMKWGNIIRPTIPIRSFVQNGPMINFLEKYFGKKLIEDLPIPFAAVASDLKTGDAHIMKSGSLSHAISASTAIPSIMRPVKFQGKVLCDGAIVHPVPAALVKSMGADIVIAVNVCAESFSKGTSRHFIDSLLNTIDIMSAKMVREELQIADVILRPDLGLNQISFKDHKFCIDAGERIMKSSIEQLQQAIKTFN